MAGEFELVPKTFSKRYDMLRNGQVVAHIDMGVWREGGTVHVGDEVLTFRRERAMSGDFQLLRGEEVVVSADKPSAFRSRFVIHWRGRDLELARRSGFGRAYELLDGDRIVGAVRPANMFSRRSVVDVPPDMEPPVVLFWVALVLLMWDRDDSSAASSTPS